MISQTVIGQGKDRVKYQNEAGRDYEKEAI